MRINLVEDTTRVFEMQDILPADLFAQVINEDWLSAPWQKQEGQESWPRRAIRNNPVAEQVSSYLATLQTEIEDALNVVFHGQLNQNSTVLWLDEPGFTVPVHTDGELAATMQLFWSAPGPEYGTFFRKYKNSDLIKQFDFIPNTGYIMLNGKNADGSQPLNWHGMLTPVPPNTYRLCSYTVFGPYTDK